MKPRRILSLALIVVLLGGPGRALAADGDSMVRTKSGLNGLSVVNTVCYLLGCQVKVALLGSVWPRRLALVGVVTSLTRAWNSTVKTASVEAVLT